MAANHTHRVECLFCRAIEIPSPKVRQAFLDEACAGAPSLKSRILRLVDAHFKAGHFLDIQDPIERRAWPESLDDPALEYVCELFSEILHRRPDLNQAKRQLEIATRKLDNSSLEPHEQWVRVLRKLIAICEQDEVEPVAVAHKPR